MIGIVRRFVSRRPTACAAWGLVLLLAGAADARAQVGRWTAHTSLREVVALSASADAVWAATTGGVFSYAPGTGEIRRFTAAEGLHNVQTRAVAYDARRSVVWIGYSDGVLDRLDPASGQVDTFFDIERSRFPAREINRLVVQGDSLLVATGFGLVVFDPERREVRDTYSQLGTLARATPVRDAMVAPLPDGSAGFWLATSEGIAYAPLQAPNLQDPGAWTVEQAGLPSRRTWSVEVFEGQLYVGTEAGLARRQTEGAYTALPFTDRTIFDLAPLPDRLLALDDFKLYGVFGQGGSVVLADGYQGLSSVVEGPEGTVWLGDRQTGLNHLARPVGNERPDLLRGEIYPDGPFDGLFGDLTVDPAGNLWAAAVEGSAGTGFYRLDAQGDWTNYTRRFFDALAGRGSFRQVHADAQGNLWAASFGNGLAQVTPEGELRVYDESNSSLQSAAGFPGFLIVGGVGSDADGTLWATSTTAPQPLHVRTPDGQWTALPSPQCPGFAPTTALGSLFVDSFGQKWITVLELGDLQRTRGLLVLDTGASATDPADDTCRFLGQRGSLGQGLPSLAITAVTEDRTGRVWIGTEEGPAFVVSSTVAARDASAVPIWPQWADRSQGVFVLSGLRINDLAVDPSNRLWVATNLGVYLLEPAQGNYRSAERFTEDNAPLFSNTVLAATVDGATGEVYFATSQGLISLRGDAIAPVARKRDLFVYPNPVRLSGEAAADIFIEGLVEETRVQVVAPHGEVVARFDARGGRARWDGRDLNRQLVPSGVYLIVAVGQNGEGAAYGKLAVIR